MLSAKQNSPLLSASLHIAIAVSATVIVFVGLQHSGQDFVVDARAAAQAVPVGAVAVSTLLAGLVAHLLARFAVRREHPRRFFLGITLSGLLLSALPPALSATTLATAAWLMVLHVLVAALLPPAVGPRSPCPQASICNG